MKAGSPSSGSPPPRRRTNDTTNATIEPVRVAFASKSANRSWGHSGTEMRSLVKNHRALTRETTREGDGEANAATAINTGGTTNAIVNAPDRIDCPVAARGDRHERTR